MRKRKMDEKIDGIRGSGIWREWGKAKEIFLRIHMSYNIPCVGMFRKMMDITTKTNKYNSSC